MYMGRAGRGFISTFLPQIIREFRSTGFRAGETSMPMYSFKRERDMRRRFQLEARAIAVQAGSERYPNVTLGGRAGRTRNPPTTFTESQRNVFNASGAISWANSVKTIDGITLVTVLIIFLLNVINLKSA